MAVDETGASDGLSSDRSRHADPYQSLSSSGGCEAINWACLRAFPADIQLGARGEQPVGPAGHHGSTAASACKLWCSPAELSASSLPSADGPVARLMAGAGACALSHDG